LADVQPRFTLVNKGRAAGRRGRLGTFLEEPAAMPSARLPIHILVARLNK
jgi:hypothetical protein